MKRTNAVAARAVTDRQTDTHSNPRCACAPRVNEGNSRFDRKCSSIDAKSAERVIQGLRDHPLQVLNPRNVHTKINISIDLAYKYLKPELKLLCYNLSHFPGSFDRDTALFFFKFSTDMLDELVQRSLVQSSHGRQRYYFHQLLRKFFLSKEGGTLLHFDAQFQLYFTGILETIISEVKLTTLDEEKHNIIHMFTLFETAKSTKIRIKMAIHAIEMNVLQTRFLPVEIYGITQDMLSALDTYTPLQQAMVTSFLETYFKVVKFVAQHQCSVNKAGAIKTLKSRTTQIDVGYMQNLICVNTYFNLLAQYYKWTGENRKAASCDTHILNTIHGQLKHCSPDCDYLSISIAYEMKALKCKTLGGIQYTMHCQGPCIILRMRVECLAAPCRPSPVSRLFHGGCTSS